MSAFSGAVLALVLAANCHGSTQGGGTKPTKESFVPGEVIVKFAEGTPAARSPTRGESERELQNYLEGLAKQLGVPLKPAQSTSGPELLLSIDEARLGDTVLAKLEADHRIASVEPRLGEPRSITESPQPQFLVKFQDSALRTESAHVDFMKTLEKELGVPLEHYESSADLILTVDIFALTLDLVKKLEARTDVDYAQTNALLQPH
jgi:hypothetical protein